MKSAFLLSDDPNLFGQLVAVLRELCPERLGASAQVAQLRDGNGRLFTVHSEIAAGFEWEFREGPFVSAYPEMRLPDFSSATACVIECRWEDLFVETTRLVATQLSRPAWVLDGKASFGRLMTLTPAGFSSE